MYKLYRFRAYLGEFLLNKYKTHAVKHKFYSLFFFFYSKRFTFAPDFRRERDISVARGVLEIMFRAEITVKGQSRIVLTKIKLHD